MRRVKMGEFGIGQPVPREEDPYLLKGQGRYVDDVNPPQLARAYVLRSPHAHARITSINAKYARTLPGVLLVLTGNDPALLALGLQRPWQQRKRRDGSSSVISPQPLLAHDHVHYVGDPVAFVVAETLHQAKDAVEAIQIEYETRPAVPTTEAAMEPGAPPVWNECPDNIAYLHELGDKASTDMAFANARHVIHHRMVINRLTTAPMEPRGCLAEYDPRDDRTTLRCTVQVPHMMRRTIAEEIFKVPETKFRIIAENVGGGFGMKGALYPEYPLTALATQLTSRPVKWMSERGESFLSDEHCRDNVTTAELALDAGGKFLGLRVQTYANIGAYYTSDRAAGPPINNLGVLAGTYVMPAIYVEVNGTHTNTMMTGHYRGAGRPEAAYVLETLVDLAARKLDIDPAELRRRNTIPADAMPFRTALVYTYDCGDFGRNLDDCLAKADYKNFHERRSQSAANRKLRGIGVSNTVASTNFGLIERAELRFDPTGALTVALGTQDHGQGHATSFRQIVASKLGIPPDRVRFQHGDTDQVSIGTGTFGSRSTIAGGTALLTAADKIIAKGRKLAAHAMEADEQDVVFESGRFIVAGTDKAITLSDIAQMSFSPKNLPNGMEPGLFESGTFDGGNRTFPNGCHIAEIEIDADTGAIEIVRYSAVEDVGHVINPLLVAGQIHGGIAQGVGQALMENIVYDSAGQLVSGSFMDYAMPRAHNFCTFDLGENEVPTKSNPLGVKGAGESGTVGAFPAVMNAVNDALARVGAPYVQMPATSEKVWWALQGTHS